MLSSPATGQRFVVLDSFRGLCALSVVVFHMHLVQGFSELHFFRSAGILVEFFFALSGFVLAHRYHREAPDLTGFRRFMISRSFRILPLHLFMLLLFSLLLIVSLMRADVPHGHIATLLTSSPIGEQWLYQVLLLQAWLPQANPFAFNGPAWSISVEYYLYLAFGLILLFAGRQARIAFAMITALCVLAVILDLGFIDSGAFRGITCFFMGALTYEIYACRPQRNPGIKAGTALELLMLAALYFVITLHFPMKSLFASIAFCLAILLFAGESGLISKCLRSAWLVHLGHWSFSIYLTHYLILQLIQTTLPSLWPAILHKTSSAAGTQIQLGVGSATGDSMLALNIVILVLMISRWTYQHIELRGMTWGKALNRRLDQCSVLRFSPNGPRTEQA